MFIVTEYAALIVWVQSYRDQTKRSFYNAITFLIVLSVSIKDTYSEPL